MVCVNKKIKRIRLGKNQQKIVTLLLGGLSLSLTRNPKKQFRILGEIHDELSNFDERYLKRSIRALYESKVIDYRENKDGTGTLILSDRGKKKAITCDIYNIEIKKPKKWDGKWRFVMFDIPERKRGLRRILGGHLKVLGFFEFQKSVFAYPYDCSDEVNYIIENYEVREFVRFITAESVDNELHLKHYFDLVSKDDLL